MLIRRHILPAAAGLLAAPGLAVAQSWPRQPIRLVVPFPPAATSAGERP
jgi:tripartite-type tricarboxylate transporter receptor subunit TctC